MNKNTNENTNRRRICILTGGATVRPQRCNKRSGSSLPITGLPIQPVGVEDAFNGLLETPNRLPLLNLANVSGILSSGGTILGTTNHGDPFAFPVEQPNGDFQLENIASKIKQNMDANAIEGLICIGGDGTLLHRRETDAVARCSCCGCS